MRAVVLPAARASLTSGQVISSNSTSCLWEPEPAAADGVGLSAAVVNNASAKPATKKLRMWCSLLDLDWNVSVWPNRLLVHLDVRRRPRRGQPHRYVRHTVSRTSLR